MPGPIRPASIDDLPAVERIVHDAYVKYISRMGKIHDRCWAIIASASRLTRFG